MLILTTLERLTEVKRLSLSRAAVEGAGPAVAASLGTRGARAATAGSVIGMIGNQTVGHARLRPDERDEQVSRLLRRRWLAVGMHD
jgi:hypothetical protein